MIIISDKYGVLIDSDNYTLVKRGVIKEGKRAGEETTAVLGYYSTLDNALYASLDKIERDELSKSDMSVGEAISTVRRLHKDMKQTISTALERNSNA